MTEIDFVDGDEASDAAAQNYQKHLSDTQGLSLRTIKNTRVEEIKGSPPPPTAGGHTTPQ